MRGSAKAHLRVVREAPLPAPAGGVPIDDAELLASVQDGDQDAATALLDRLRPRIESTVRRLLGPGDRDHDDCVQNAFIELVRSIDRYRGECSIEHWGAQIAARVVYRTIRKRRTERRLLAAWLRPDSDEAVDPPSRPSEERHDGIDPVRHMIARDLLARIREKLSTLDPDKTYAFLLHDVLGFDLKEIADITGVSVAAAQKRLVRGRRSVHAALVDEAELGAAARDIEEEP